MSEQVANGAVATLANGMDGVTTTMVLTSAGSMPTSPNFRVRVGTELMLVTAGAGTTTWTVTRGVESTTATPHSAGEFVVHVLTAGGLNQFVDEKVAPKAPTASPVFTGNPTAPTPIASDNDTSLATTQFVHAAIAADVGSTLPGSVLNGVALWNGTTWVNALVGPSNISPAGATDGQVLGRVAGAVAWMNPSGTVPNSTLQVSGAKATTIDRRAAAAGAATTLTSGTLLLVAIEIDPGTVVSSINWMSGNVALVTGSNLWAGLFDSNRVMLARSADLTTAAWGVSSRKNFPIAQVAAGAASTYTTQNTVRGLFYVGLCSVAATVPNLTGATTVNAAQTSSGAPLTTGTSSTGQTTPPAFPFTAAAMTGVAGTPLSELL